ncbi:hypothetical protein [Desulfohalobium retbaense]|uniref:Uncharacterized protein n=1 Tax=Desulfohalobium retbaense (strain ATCC 49708 / DSM 5692 / JCM 16813 / HR100) TaxID=485915 RepID=C8X5X3_DESRD|nr:hypothetical protein [Desulfohalobium retbaense]ACV69820.1 hypothetical protein Dret_2544 [Desulfohalobium retbaense DSM 5692]
MRVSGLVVQFKTAYSSKKKSWQTLSLDKAEQSIFGSVGIDKLASGEAGVWLTPRAHDSAGDTWHMAWWDVEHPDEHHTSIEANTRTAQDLFIQLDGLGLAHGLSVVLSGKGFRFLWPFVIPSDYTKAYRAMITDKGQWVGLDPSPHMAPNRWFRFLGYRGHRKQDTNPKDRHIHLLEHPAHLLDLTETTYLELVQGKPDPATFRPWMRRLLPHTTEPPPEWVELLKKYNDILRLRSHIVKLNFPKKPKPRGVDWAQIETFLTQKGIRTWDMQDNGEIFYRLTECPMCGRRDGNPWMTQAGRLKCFHANTCPAGEEHTDLQGQTFKKGLPPEKWVEGYQEIEVSPPVQEDQREKTDVKTARERIRDALRSDEDVLIRAAPGVGKTHTTLEEILPQCRDRLVLFTVPKGENVAEIYEKALSLAPEGVEIRKIRGRRREENGSGTLDFNPPPEGICYNMDYVEEVANWGYSPGLICCTGCEHQKNCPYQEQFKSLPKTGLVIAAHESAVSLPKKRHFDLWVIDENPVASLLQTKTVSPGALSQIRAKLPRRSELPLDTIKAQGEGLLKYLAGNQHEGRIYATTPPAEWKNTESVWELGGIESHKTPFAEDLSCFDQLEEENLKQWQKRLYYSEKVNFTALEWLWTATGQQAGVAYIKARADRKHPISYVLHQTKAPGMRRANQDGSETKTRIVALDGTGNKQELEALFPNRSFAEVSADVDLPGRRVHLEYNLSKTTVCGAEKYKKTPMAPQHVKAKLKEGLKCLRTEEKRVLLVTFKDAKETVLRAAQNLDPGRTFEVTHFWGNRGLNCFQECDAVICFGSPRVAPHSVKDMASSLFDDTEQQKAWTEQQGHRDVVQSIHRIRPIYSRKSVIVMGDFWPEQLGTPQFRIRAYQKNGAFDLALERLKLVAQTYGFVTRELACLHGVFCRVDTQSIAKWMELQKRFREKLEESPSEFVFFPINIFLIGNHTNKNGLLDPIKLKDTHAWNDLVSALELELGFPSLTERQSTGAGRPSRGVGTVSAARRFYHALGVVVFDESLWSGQEHFFEIPVGKLKRRVLPGQGLFEARRAKSVLLGFTSEIRHRQQKPPIEVFRDQQSSLAAVV